MKAGGHDHLHCGASGHHSTRYSRVATYELELNAEAARPADSLLHPRNHLRSKDLLNNS
jgi:hypothetical protein